MINNIMEMSYELIPSQKNIFYDQVKNESVPCYNVGVGIKVENEVDYSIFAKTIKYIVEQNEALRTRIYEDFGIIKQRYVKEVEFNIDYIDFSHEMDADLKIVEYMQTRYRCAINLLNNNLFEFALLKENNECYYIFLKFHHIITDGWACILISKQILQDYYDYIMNGRFIEKEEYKYSTYLSYWGKYSKSPKYNADKVYWDNKFSVICEPLMGNIDYKYPISREKTFSISREQIKGLSAICREKNCTILHCFLGILTRFFSETFLKNEIVIGVPVLNRRTVKEKMTVGLFDNILPIRIKNINNFDDMLAQITRDVNDSFRHCRYPFSIIASEYQNRFECKDNLFDVVLSYIKLDSTATEGFSGIDTVKLSHLHEKIALGITVRDIDNEKDVQVDLDYRKELFMGNTIDVFIEKYLDYMTSIINGSM